jgi:hypothetical protein
MKKIFVLLLLAFGANAQLADSLAIQTKAAAVVDKYINAIGGRAAIANIKDITISSTTDTPRGVSETELKFKFPYQMVMSVFANGMDIFSQICDGTKLVRKSGMMAGGGQNREKEGKEAQLEVMAMSPFAETTLAERGVYATAVFEEKLEDMATTRVDFKSAAGQRSSAWYDNATGFKVKSSAVVKTPRGENEQVQTFADYTKFKGTEVLLPKKTIRANPMMGGEMVSEIGSVKINKGLEDKAFTIKN